MVDFSTGVTFTLLFNPASSSDFTCAFSAFLCTFLIFFSNFFWAFSSFVPFAPVHININGNIIPIIAVPKRGNNALTHHFISYVNNSRNAHSGPVKSISN